MELGELELDALEKECEKEGKGYVSHEQLQLLQEANIRSKSHQALGIIVEPQKGGKRKYPKEDMKRGRKTSKQRIVAIGVKLIESG